MNCCTALLWVELLVHFTSKEINVFLFVLAGDYFSLLIALVAFCNTHFDVKLVF